MEDEIIQQIKDAINTYERKVSRIKQLGYYLGPMYQSRSGRGYLQWWIRVGGKKRYVRKSEYKEIRAKYHRGRHLKRFAEECIQQINIALSGKIRKGQKLK